MPGLFLQISNLTSGHFYRFRVFAGNVVGIGKPSEPSEAFLCEKWTMPEPGEVNVNCFMFFYSKPQTKSQFGAIMCA